MKEIVDLQEQESKKINLSKELKNLQLGITKEYQEFKKLAESPLVKSGLKKIFDKTSQKAFEEERKKFKEVNIGGYLNHLVQKHRGLAFFISGKLKLPTSDRRFSDLTTEQKISFTALYRAINPSKIQKFFAYKEGNSVTNIVNNYKLSQKEVYNDINSQFQWMNLKNFGRLENTLISDFWLSQKEALACIKYLKVIEKNPQFINIFKSQEANLKPGLALLGIGIVLGALWYHFIANLWNPTPESNINGGRTKIENPENILRLLTQESKFENSGQIEKKMLVESKDDHFLIDIGKRIVNKAQSKTVTMELQWKLALQYDMGAHCEIIIDHNTGIIELTMPKPTVVISESKSYIKNKSNELIQLKQFDNTELELQAQLKQKALDDALHDPNFYEVAKKQTRETLLPLFISLKPYGIEIKDLVIKEALTVSNPKE